MQEKYIKIKHIRWIALLGLTAIVSLQYVWLLNTYRLTKESVQAKSELVFKDAVMQEVFLRLEKLDKGNQPDSTTSLQLHLSETFGGVDSVENVNQWMMSNVHIAMQEAVVKEFNLRVSLPTLDSIYTANLAAEGIKAKVICCLADSSGRVLESSRPMKTDAYGLLKTVLRPIDFQHRRHLQAFIVNPYWVIFQRMTLLLVATLLIMVAVIWCIVYQIRMIGRQNKIAKLREDFSYAMIHDMKTPLSSILMGTQILESGKLDALPEKRARYFRILKEEGEHLLSLTNKVLTLSKLENRQLRLAKEEVALRGLLEDLCEKFTAKAVKPVHFSLYLETGKVYADAEFLKEAISNLIDNSIKYSGESVAISLSAGPYADGSYWIKVKDNGLGIPLEDQRRIFEKYERAAAVARSRKGGATGFGLGLNYVFRIAEAHGGSVSVESIEGAYSEFTICLPGKEME